MPVTRSIQSLSQAGIHCGTTPFDGSSDGTDGEDTSLASAHKAGDINLASPSQLPSGWRPFGSPHALLRRSEPAIPHDPQGCTVHTLVVTTAYHQESARLPLPRRGISALVGLGISTSPVPDRYSTGLPRGSHDFGNPATVGARPGYPLSRSLGSIRSDW